MINPVLDRSTDTVAVAAVTSPFWLPFIESTSEVAASFVPILGVLWLLIQIVGYFRRKDK